MDIHLEIKKIMDNLQDLQIPSTYGNCTKIKSILESLVAINTEISVEPQNQQNEEP